MQKHIKNVLQLCDIDKYNTEMCILGHRYKYYFEDAIRSLIAVTNVCKSYGTVKLN